MKNSKKLTGSMLALIAVFAMPSFAQDDTDDSVLDRDVSAPTNVRTYKGDPLNISGIKENEEPVPTDGELESIRHELNKQKSAIIINKEKGSKLKDLSRTTEKLTDAHEQMIEEKIDAQKAISEHNKKFKANEERLKCLEANNWDKSKCPKNGQDVSQLSDSVKNVQANTVVADLNSTKGSSNDPEEKNFKFIPYAGMTMYQGVYKGISDTFETKLNTGLRFETRASRRFAIGLGFNYSNMDITQTPNFYNYYFGMFSFPNGSNFMGREIGYKSFGADLYTKFYIVPGGVIAPYLGAGIGYSRTSLKFKTETSNMNGYVPYGPDISANGYTSNNMIGEAMGGVDLNFTDNFGANVEFKYARAVLKSYSSELDKYNVYNYQLYYAKIHDQYFVESLGDDIDSANLFSITAGLTLSF